MPADRVTSLSPWHVVLALDDSDTMRGTASAELNDIVREVIAEMDVASKGTKPYFRLSILVFGDDTIVLDEWKDARAIDIDRAASVTGAGGKANLEKALAATREILERNPGNPGDFRPYVFLFIGDSGAGGDQATLREAVALKRLSLAAGAPKVVVFALGAASAAALSGIATSPELARRPEDPQSLYRLFPPIGTIAGAVRNGEQRIDDIIMSL